MSNRNQAQQWLIRAVSLHQAGKLGDAVSLYRAVLGSDPKNADAMRLLGTLHSQLNNHHEAVPLLENSLKAKPRQPDALNNLGIALHGLKHYDAALVSYDKAIALKPDYDEAWYNRGLLLQDSKRHEEALASYDKVIALNSHHVDAHNGRGNALQRMGRNDEALASYGKAVALKPDYVLAYKNMAITLGHMQRYNEALAIFDKAITIRSDYAEAYNNRGVVFEKIRNYSAALANYDQAITLKPDYVEAWYNRGNVLQDMRRHDEALVAYEKAMALCPDTPYLLGAYLHTKMHLADWHGIDAICDTIAKALEANKPVTTPFYVITAPFSLSQQKQCAEIYIQDKFPPAATQLWNGERYAHDKIRLGYFSADFHNHATAYLMAELFERHDRARFDITAFSFGPASDHPMRKRLEKAFDRFIDVSAKSDLEIATLARGMEIDIAVDLKGFTQNSRTGIFALRPAPVQVNYLGYPGTMGASYIDYLIADQTLIPEHHKQYYSEKIAYLPDSYQVNDTSRKISGRQFTRQEMGLPEEGFVFCCFNNSYKITPDIFDIWMRLLHAVKGSVLWLLEGNPMSAKNLRKEATGRGISENRLVFAPRAELADHLARHKLADLFLDTFYCNAHTTASDALWAGLPVLTCLGETFAGRVAASLLNAIELPELVTASHAEYEALALALATHPHKLSAIRKKLAENRTSSPLFNTALFTQHLENAYINM